MVSKTQDTVVRTAFYTVGAVAIVGSLAAEVVRHIIGRPRKVDPVTWLSHGGR